MKASLGVHGKFEISYGYIKCGLWGNTEEEGKERGRRGERERRGRRKHRREEGRGGGS